MQKSTFTFGTRRDYRGILEGERYVGFFDDRAEYEQESDSGTVESEYWLQRWLAIAQSIGISKTEMLENYYYDEFIAMLDAYNDMHRIDSESESGKEYYADDF